MNVGQWAIWKNHWGKPHYGRIREIVRNERGIFVDVDGWATLSSNTIRQTFDHEPMARAYVDAWHRRYGQSGDSWREIPENDRDLETLGRRITEETCARRNILLFHVRVTRPPNHPLRKCACGCGKKFIAGRHNQIYATTACIRRQQQRRKRAREKASTTNKGEAT